MMPLPLSKNKLLLLLLVCSVCLLTVKVLFTDLSTINTTTPRVDRQENVYPLLPDSNLGHGKIVQEKKTQLLLHLDMTPSQTGTPTQTIIKVPEKSTESKPGFVFGLLFWEQISNGAYNVMNLQCWASMVGLEVLEPSIRDSGSGDQVFHFTQDYKNTKRFSDLFDIDQWNKYAQDRHFVPLKSMETFLESASRNVIYVEAHYSMSPCPGGVTKTLSSTKEFHTVGQFGSALYNGPYSFLHSHGFRIVRTVCVNLLQDGRLRTQKEFNELVFGDLIGHAESFTVIFDEWRGIRNESEREGKMKWVEPDKSHYRIIIKDSPCYYFVTKHGWYNIKKMTDNFKVEAPKNELEGNISAIKTQNELGLIPSVKVLANTAEYSAKNIGNKPYVAVMMRLENLQFGIGTVETYARCFETAMKYWKYMTETYGLSQTFITSDLGNYGSHSWGPSSSSPSVRYHQEFMKAVGLLPSFPETRDKTLMDIMHTAGRVEMAWTQSIIAAQARCILFLGAGSYQGLIVNIHSAMYSGRECFVFLEKFCAHESHLGVPKY